MSRAICASSGTAAATRRPQNLLHRLPTPASSGATECGSQSPCAHQLHYSANRACPIFDELASILRKTAGLADVLRAALLPLQAHIHCALVFGSVARGEEHAGSDVDVLLVGGIAFGAAVRALHPMQEQLQREINPVVMSPEEWRRRLAEGDGLVCGIMAKDKIFLMGGANELGQSGNDQPTAETLGGKSKRIETA